MGLVLFLLELSSCGNLIPVRKGKMALIGMIATSWKICVYENTVRSDAQMKGPRVIAIPYEVRNVPMVSPVLPFGANSGVIPIARGMMGAIDKPCKIRMG